MQSKGSGGINWPHKYIEEFTDIPTAAEYEDVPMPEWSHRGADGKVAPQDLVYVRATAMSEAERQRFLSLGEMPDDKLSPQEYSQKIEERRAFFASGERDRRLVQLTYVKSDGSPLFTPSQVDELYNRRNPAAFLRLKDAAERISLITIAAMAEFTKNLGGLVVAVAAGRIDSQQNSE